MSSFSTFLIIVVVLLLGFAGYYYLDQIAPLQVAHADLIERNEDLRFQIAQLEQQNAALTAQLEQTVEELSVEKEKEVERLKLTYEDLVGSLREQIKRGEVTITQLADELKVKIVDQIIFPSGTAELRESGKKVLQQVGDILKTIEDKRIVVEGHTDNVRIHPNLRDQFPSNWELSVARATNVVRFLQEEAGVPAAKLEVSGKGQYHPVASNKTRQGRRQNRRIEILLLPSPGHVQNLGQKPASN